MMKTNFERDIFSTMSFGGFYRQVAFSYADVHRAMKQMVKIQTNCEFQLLHGGGFVRAEDRYIKRGSVHIYKLGRLKYVRQDTQLLVQMDRVGQRSYLCGRFWAIRAGKITESVFKSEGCAIARLIYNNLRA